MGPTEQYAHFINEVQFEDIPEEAINKSKQMFIDSIGVALVGTLEPSGRIALKYAKEVGGNPEAGVLGSGFQISAPMAAFTNALLAHNMDFDDWLPAGEEKDNWPTNDGHASGIMVSIALALGEKLSLSGKALLLAYVVGMEVYTKIAAACPNARARGWHSMGVYGCLGGAAAAAKLLDLDVHQTAMALGMATSAAGGLHRANVRFNANAYHAGRAARSGIEAAWLPKQGFTANDVIIEYPLGFCETFLGPGAADYDKMTRSLGKPFYMASPSPGIKPYPCGWPSHSMVQATLELKKQHTIAYEDIQEVEISIVPNKPVGQTKDKHFRGNFIQDIPEPTSGYMGRFSWNFICASALIDGKLDRDTFNDARVKDPRVKELISKIKIVDDKARSDPKYAGSQYAPLVIKLKDGREYRNAVEVPKGHPKNPLAYDEVLAKYRGNAGLILSQEQIARSIKLIESLEEASNVGGLMGIVSKRAAR